MRSIQVVMLVTVLSLSTVVTGGAQPAAEMLDQAVGPAAPGSGGIVIGVAGSSVQQPAQVFTPTRTGLLTRLRLHLSRSTGADDNLIVEIRPVNTLTWTPEPTILAQQVVEPAAVPEGLSNANWVDVVFDQPATVTARTPYAIVVRLSGDATPTYAWTRSSEVYLRGFGTHGFVRNGVESWRIWTRPPFGEDSRPFEAFITTTQPPLIEATAPICVLGNTGADAQGQKFIEVKAHDPESGLARIKVMRATNLTLDPANFNQLNPPAFPHGTTEPVIVHATKIDQTTASQLILEVVDVDGNVTTCDPVDLLVTRSTGAPVTHTLTGIPEAEGTISITNQTPGVKVLDIVVNGTRFKLTGLRDGETQTIDVAAAMHVGDDNVISLEARGPKGGSVYVLIWDGVTE